MGETIQGNSPKECAPIYSWVAKQVSRLKISNTIKPLNNGPTWDPSLSFKERLSSFGGLFSIECINRGMFRLSFV